MGGPQEEKWSLICSTSKHNLDIIVTQPLVNIRNDIFWSTWDVGQLLQKGVAHPIASAQQTEKRINMIQESKYTPARNSPPALSHIERQERISEPKIWWATGYQMEISSRDEERPVEQ